MTELQEQLALGGVSRHETFTPRYGWLKKGYDAASGDGKVFSAPDAIERLGVGKNMVRSIRSWCLAFHVLEHNDGESRKGQKGVLRPTRFGKRLLSDDGWDPYLEDLASLWLLNYQLFVPPFQMASWPLAFNHCVLPTFDPQQLTRTLVSAARQYEKLSTLSEGSFDKDASCLIRMYGAGNGKESTEIDCPFSRLGILRVAEDPRMFRFVIGEKETLPGLIFAACCFLYAEETQATGRTLALHKIVYEFNSPGIVFKITETAAGRLLDDAARQMRSVEFVESMGNRQLHFQDRPVDLFWRALELYYEGSAHRGMKK